MRRKLYYGLLIAAAYLAGWLSAWDFNQSQDMKSGILPMIREDGWNPVIAEDVNRNPISLYVDGKEVRTKKHPLYMSDNLEFMVPMDAIPKAFMTAASLYGGEHLVLERNALRVEMFVGQALILVDGQEVEVWEKPVFKDGMLYVPLSSVYTGLEYQYTWEMEEGRILLIRLFEQERFLPYQYDYRVKGRSPDVKNQGNLGTCWAFAALAGVKTTLMPEEKLDFSEDHMSIRNSFDLTQNDGGEYTMSMAYLTAWQGPVYEAEDPYGDGVSPEGLAARKHIQEIQILPSKDIEKIKEAVYLYGGVQSSLYTSLKNYKSRSIYYNAATYSYCYIGTEKPNHDVVIVGWDDNYSRDNFNMDLEGDGAFLCINSWGEEFGDSGFFYVSYYDTNIGIHNILYSGIEEPDNYSNIYQADLCGWIGQLGYGREEAFFANVYQAEGDEVLAAAGFYATGADTEYEVYVARNVTDSISLNDREMVASGKLHNAGFYTINLDDEILLNPGERFAIIVNIKTPGAIHPIAIEYDGEGTKPYVDISDGEGYISLRGSKWERVEESQKCNICLKAYTNTILN